MKTARFDYTDMSEVVSSAIDALYYNSDSGELAVKFNYSGTAFYEGVPYEIFRRVSESDSPGSAYNNLIRGNFQNTSGGTIADVTFASHDDNANEELVNSYTVAGFVEFSHEIYAKSPREAAEKFSNALVNAGYHRELVKVREVIEN